MSEAVLIAGLGRCGTSMVSQMFHAGGAQMIGRFPAFEPDEMNPLAIGDMSVTLLPGYVGKMVSPDLLRRPIHPGFRLIWLDRNTKEQAKSSLKFTRILAGKPAATREQRRRMQRKIKADMGAALRNLRNATKIVRWSFEEILANPRAAASHMSEWGAEGLGYDLDPVAMAGAVIPRGPECAPDLSLEASLL